jgi:Ca2+-binding RTX toxin-like protein
MSNLNPIGNAIGSLQNGKPNTLYTIYETTLLQGFSDPDGDTLKIASLWANNGELSDLGDGKWSFFPETDYSGIVTLDYILSDSKGGEVEGILNFNIVSDQASPTGDVIISTIGIPAQNQTLTVSNTLSDANGLGAITYQWLSGGTAISGATSTSYTLKQSEVGKAISVKASYTDGLGKVESVTSMTTEIVSNVNDIPTGNVSITGTITQGQTLSASNTLADVDGLGSISYQWLRDKTIISGATKNTYILTQDDVGKAISVKASYTDGFGKLESVNSSETYAVSNINDLPKGSVYINGKPNQEQILTVSNDINDADGLGVIAYQWLRNGSLINGANKNSYTLTVNDVNSSISVKASYTDGYGTNESITSSTVTALPPGQTPPTGEITIKGTPKQNETLTVNQSLADINGLGTLSYEWLRDKSTISGATQLSYVLTQADVGKPISVRASYTDGLGKLESVTSAETAAVINVNDSPTGTVTISGTAKQGQILTASSNLADADGLGTISYQWLRNGESISNAINTNYTLTQADANQSLSVKASYVDGQGTRENLNSSSLTVVPSNMLSVNSPIINEGDTGQSNLTFTLSLSLPLQQSGSVDYTLQSGTATASTDFSASSGTVQFNAGETSKTITVPILGDTTIENDETFTLALSNPINIDLSNSSKSMTIIGTIRNDDFPTLSIANTPSIKEGNSGQSNLIFTLQLSDVPLSAVSVDYVTKDSTATAGEDFITQTGTLKFAAGEKQKTISVPVLGDQNEESDEALSLVLSNSQNAKFSNNSAQLNATGTILNDDSQSIRVNSPSIQEGDSGTSILKFVVSLGLPASNNVSFDYKTEDGTAVAQLDYLAKTGTVTIPAGSQNTDIPIYILGDTRIEANETIKLTLSNAQGIILPSGSLPTSSTGTILDDDFPIVSIRDNQTVYQPKIGATNASITISLLDSNAKNIQSLVDGVISYHTESGSALQGKDFIDDTSGKLTIPANSDLAVINIPILAADSSDTPNETFKLVIDKVDGGIRFPANQSSLSLIITIADQTLPLLSVQNAQFFEGDTGNKDLKLNVSLSEIAKQDVTFIAKTIDKTATNGQDYQGILAKPFTIPAGSQSIDVPVSILGDTTPEADETFTLELSKINNAVFDNGDVTLTATGKILDDDKPVIRIENIPIIEGNSGVHDAQVKVTLNTAAVTPITVHYASLDGTANAGEDFIPAEGDLTIPIGAKEAYIPISIQGDTKPESDQDFHVVLSNPVNGQFLNSALIIQNTVTIKTDDGDNLPLLTVTQKPVYEGDKDTIDYPVTLTLSTAATYTFTVDYQTLSGDAKASSDFIAASGTVTFLSGEKSAQVILKVLGDTEVETDENFILQLSNPQGIRLANNLPTQDISLTIQDDDAEPAQTLQGTPKNDILDATKAEGTGDDSLDGLKGIDTMIGGDGNDTYYVDNVKDVIVEGDQAQSNAGDDDLVHSTAAAYTLPANVEHLIIDGKAKGNGTGNALDNRLTGNIAVNVLSGLAGNDTLDGGSGNDALTGGDGADTFIFSSGIKGNKNIDTVKDFVHGQDKIYLSADIFPKLAVAVGFVSGNEPLSLAKANSHYLVSGPKVKAVDASSYLLYDTATGRLSYDEDGSGKLAASTFVTLTGKPTLTLDDFWIY